MGKSMSIQKIKNNNTELLSYSTLIMIRIFRLNLDKMLKDMTSKYNVLASKSDDLAKLSETLKEKSNTLVKRSKDFVKVSDYLVKLSDTLTKTLDLFQEIFDESANNQRIMVFTKILSSKLEILK